MWFSYFFPLDFLCLIDVVPSQLTFLLYVTNPLPNMFHILLCKVNRHEKHRAFGGQGTQLYLGMPGEGP